MNPDELEKYMASWDAFWKTDEGKEMQKSIQEEMDKQLRNSFAQAAKMNAPVAKPRSSGFYSFSAYHGISPTDKDAVGMYEYQEPEVDEQGTFYGYKVLTIRSSMRFYPVQEPLLESPRYPAQWMNGELCADMCPDEHSMSGIHFTKRFDHRELTNYFITWEHSVIVKCALSGTIVETEQGFRAEHAQIIGVYSNGNWQSYQDYQERATGHSRSNPFEKEWRYISSYPRQSGKGTWDITFDPSADS